ncbi:MAG TPA: CaiB/BaiF CoA-transferase family protein [Kiloniellales bacterium]|nr:CaiB/BaiF CoA-transferase family protein [Kiloniellales bacterium]
MSELEGLLVVSVEHAVAAPYASVKLADAGARVIKVERPGGDFARDYDALAKGSSSYFVWLNRGKESVCLDLKSEEDRTILSSLLQKADILIQNLGPGVLARLGFDPARLLEERPELIVCSISGYGSEGPRAQQKAYDLLIQAESGLCAINGTPEGPARVGVSVCDIAAGMTAYQAILEALIARMKSGKGRHIQVSLFHAMADWMNVPYLQHRYGGATPGRQGLQHPTIAPYGAFPCADGKVLLLSIQSDREWRILCEKVLKRSDLARQEGFATNRQRVANRAEVDRLVGEHMLKSDRESNISELQASDIACGRLSELEDLVVHPQNRHIRIHTEGGELELLAPGAFVAEQPRSYGSVPKVDEQGARIRAEFAPASGTSGRKE